MLLLFCTAVVFEFDRESYTASEDDGSVILTVTKSGQNDRSVSIMVFTESGTAVGKQL